MSAEGARRRALFPRGLAQPEGGFRFGADTLLLSAFAAAHLKPGKPLSGLDIGTGCGAASIGLLLLRPEDPLHITGIDTGPEMIASASQNALDLDLAHRYTPLLADAQDYRAACTAPGRNGPGLDFVLANPPFRVPGTGRPCPDGQRHRARFEGPGGFAAFAACAAKNLRRGGQFFLVHLSERLPELLQILSSVELHTRRLVPVQGQAETPARLALLQAVRGGGAGLALAPPLVLYDQQGALTRQAAEFCPHLATNSVRKQRNPAA